MPVFSKGVKVVNNQVIFALAFVERLLNGNKRSLFSLQQSHWIYIEYKNFRLQIYFGWGRNFETDCKTFQFHPILTKELYVISNLNTELRFLWKYPENLEGRGIKTL